MQIKVNNQLKNLTEKLTVQQLLDQVLSDKQKGIAIAINNVVIPKINWQNHFLKDNDDILIIKATQGG
jgi:sulfur carrier protein